MGKTVSLWWLNLTKLQKALVASIFLLTFGGSVGAASVATLSDYAGLPEVVDSLAVNVTRNTTALQEMSHISTSHDTLNLKVEILSDTVEAMSHAVFENRCVLRAIARGTDPAECLLGGGDG